MLFAAFLLPDSPRFAPTQGKGYILLILREFLCSRSRFKPPFWVPLPGQITGAKPATKQEKATVKKGSANNTENKNTVLKQEASANAKADSAIKLVLPLPNRIDTSAALPKVKDSDF